MNSSEKIVVKGDPRARRMAARRTTCVCCNHGDHEVSLGKGESCDCPCHGGYGAEYQSKDRLRR